MARPWPFTARGTALRIFATCWLVYCVHSATNIVREHYLMFAIGDQFSFRVDEYQGLHPDLFETPGRGWHINNNPGVSMLAAAPYALARPVIDPIVAWVRDHRRESGVTEPPTYDTPWPNSRQFFAEAWRRGLDIKFGLAALVTQALFMAPMSALMAVAMFFVLRRVFQSDRLACWLALLYAFGTPVFFRTGFLNHNLLVGYAGFLGFAALWRPGRPADEAPGTWGVVFAGIAAGVAILLDYTGVVIAAGLFVYALLGADRAAGMAAALQRIGAFALGAAPPMLLLWFYQWASFGDPWQPAQRWMPNVAWADAGYRGLSWPAPDLLMANLFDHRFGLIVSCPLLALAAASPWLRRANLLQRRETWWMLGTAAAFWMFCAGINYGRLQFNTGVRYMTSIVPLLFVLSASVLVTLPRWLQVSLVIPTVVISWSLAMHREVETDLGVAGAVLNVLGTGPQLPALTTVSRLQTGLGVEAAPGLLASAVLLLTMIISWSVWSRISMRTAPR